MRVQVLSSIIISALVAIAACTVNNQDPPGSSSSSSGGSSSGGSSSGGSSSGGSSSGSTTDKPPASTSAATIDIDGTCAAFTACGGNPQGTFDYTSGCIEDVFKPVRDYCPTVDTSGTNVTVTGSIYFLGNALHRNVTTKKNGTIVIPATCTLGMSCSAIQAQLKTAGAFDTVTCTGAAGCSCTISDTDLLDNATTYSIAGNIATTADGDQYEICESGSNFTYKGAGGGSEVGTFQMKKR